MAALVTMHHLIYQPNYLRFRITSPSLEFPRKHRLILLSPARLSYLLAFSRSLGLHNTEQYYHGTGLTMLGPMVSYASASMYMVDTYGPVYSVFVASANSLVRYVLTRIFPLSTLQLHIQSWA
jgi:hypothetical protein